MGVYQDRLRWLCETPHCEEGKTRRGPQKPTLLLILAKPFEAPVQSASGYSHHPANSEVWFR